MLKIVGDDCTSEELAAYLDFDSVDDMLASASGSIGSADQFITTDSGYYHRSNTDEIWRYHANDEAFE